MLIAQGILLVLGVYLVIGVGVAGWLLIGGMRRVDEAAARAGFVTKLLWTPGLVALWPALMARARRGGAPEHHP